jgi:hypothetical protein
MKGPFGPNGSFSPFGRKSCLFPQPLKPTETPRVWHLRTANFVDFHLQSQSFFPSHNQHPLKPMLETARLKAKGLGPTAEAKLRLHSRLPTSHEAKAKCSLYTTRSKEGANR